MHKIMCDECLLEIMPYEKECPRCGSTNFDSVKTKSYCSSDPHIVQSHIENVFRAGEVFKSSGVYCMCGSNHYMIYLYTRNKTDYNKVYKISRLTFCPERVWAHNKNINVPLRDFLERFKVTENNEHNRSNG